MAPASAATGKIMGGKEVALLTGLLFVDAHVALTPTHSQALMAKAVDLATQSSARQLDSVEQCE